MPRERVHATAIALAGKAALIRGPSGSGKSDLALRCLTAGPSGLVPFEARLVADDYVEIERRGERLFAHAPPAIRGRLEVRGIGIITLETLDEAEIRLVADLVDGALVSRLPDPVPTTEIAGVGLPVLRLAAFDVSAPAKLLLALHRGFGSPQAGSA